MYQIIAGSVNEVSVDSWVGYISWWSELYVNFGSSRNCLFPIYVNSMSKFPQVFVTYILFSNFRHSSNNWSKLIYVSLEDTTTQKLTEK